MIKSKSAEFLFGIIMILTLFVFFLINSFYSEGSIYGGDSYAHYLIAKYAFDYPINFLSHWGKPFFTLIAAPFAYFGFHCMMVFNILVCAFSSYITFLIVRKLGYANGILAIVFTLFAPIYILLMFSGLTEAFFSLILVATVYLFMNEKYWQTAVLISFIPFVRSEGIMFIGWFLLLIIVKQKYKVLPFVFTGTLFYTILGGLITNDFLWLINNNPYSSDNQIYGHGSLFDYFTNVPSTFGYLVFYLAILGFLVIIISITSLLFQKKSINNNLFNEFFVIGCAAFGYFVFHSVVWWKGWLSVFGDPRFMGAIVPLIAILGLKGFNLIVLPIKKQWIVWLLMVTVSGVMVFKALDRHQIPVHFKHEELAIKQTTEWLKKNHYDKHKLVYRNVQIPVLLDFDPFDITRAQNYIEDSQHPEQGVKAGTIMIWDGHFSRQEWQLPL